MLSILLELIGQTIPRGNENFTFNQNDPARYVIVCMKEVIFQQKLLEKAYYFVKMVGLAGQFWLLQTAVTVVGLLREGL